MSKAPLSAKKRIRVMLSLFLAGVFVLVGKLVWIQFIKGAEYKTKAAEQQTSDSAITAKRGTIYDRNMKVLAQSATAERITINPQEIEKKKNADDVIRVLTKYLDVDEENLKKKIAKTNLQSVKISDRVEKSVANKIRQENLTGIHFEEDAKRYYPYGSLAAQVIGFTGADNQGLEGLENVLEKELRGINGRIVVAKDAKNTQMPFKYESYIEAQDGKGVVLTIDEVIQHYTEKHLQEAYETNLLGNGGAAIVMDPKTGEVLAMAVVPTYDLNEPRVITDELLLKQIEDSVEKELQSIVTEELEKNPAKLEKKRQELYNKAYGNAIIKMWRNKAVVDSYEPGSTFKTLVAAAALEEGVATINDHFSCTGVRHVANRDIHCWNTNGHGEQSFTEGVMNSCNPTFMELGARLGAQNFEKYYSAFGLKEKTGFTIPGESAGTFHKTLGVVDLATSSFGQTFTITPLQLISAVSAIVNGGNLMKPQIIKAYANSQGKITESFEPELVRNVVSAQTSEIMRGVLEKVVSAGTGKGAYVSGFKIGGKTGTSEKLPRNSGKYIASFVGFAPAENPEIVCLLLLDEPNAGATGGGAIAAPAVGKIIQDTLPYLGYKAQFTEETAEEISVNVPVIEGLSIEDATVKLKDAGLKINIKGNGAVVRNQIPKSGTRLHKESVVIAYTENEETGDITTVPDVTGMTYENAKKALSGADLVLKLDSTIAEAELNSEYVAVSQSPEAKKEVAAKTAVFVKFVQREAD